MPRTTHRLSKSRFCAGLQCEKLLWWTVHEPGAPELVPDARLQSIFDNGRAVGLLARTYVPGGVAIDARHVEREDWAERTQRELEGGARLLYEPGFIASGGFVAVDILERAAEGWTLIEVKSTTKVKPEHLPDVAVQLYVLRASGLDVRRAEVMHLNAECVFPNLSDLFLRQDVTEKAEALQGEVRTALPRLFAMLERSRPEVPIGPHCSTPHDCAFHDRCWSGVPTDHVTTLYRIGRKAWDWVAEGRETVGALPEGTKLSAIADRQRRALRANRRVVEPGLRDALARFRRPIAVLDFETVNPPVPCWPGCSPYTHVPVQFSVQREEGGRWREFGWIADRGRDPRPACAEAMLEALEGAATVLTYYVPFERGVISHLAANMPRHRGALEDLERKLEDLLPVVRDHVYDPAFRGSFSIKQVLPAIVGGDGYDRLAIRDGESAARELTRLLLAPEPPDPADDARTRAALREYCALDTRAVVDLMDALAKLEPAR